MAKRMTKCLICLGVFGFIFLIAGCVLIPVLNNYIDSQIKEVGNHAAGHDELFLSMHPY